MASKKAARPKAKPHKSLDTAQLRAVAELFSALSETSRLCILQELRGGPMSVSDLVERTSLKQANVSKQLGMLLSAGILSRRQDGNRALYAIQMPLIVDLCDVVCRNIARQAAARAAALKG